MKKILPTLALLALALCGAVSPSHAQTPAPAATVGATRAAQAHLIGEVTAVEAATGHLTVKTDAGASVSVSTDERTRYRRLPPGETSLDKAETITRADVRVGDRVLVPNGATGGASAARQVIVMAREAITARREQEREDWRARGVNGRVASVDASKKELTVETRGREGAETITVAAAAGNVRFRRYAAGSLRPADAVAGSFADIRVGDQVRVLGAREGARVTAEEIISGTVARLTGTVEAVDAARGELSVKDSRTGQVVNVALVSNTTLRRIPAEFAETLRQRGERRREGAGERGGAAVEGETREQRRERRRAQRQQEGEGNRSGGGERGARQGGGGRGGQQMFENLPKITVGELKKGDSVMVTGTAGADASRVTAATLMTGDAEILQRLQRFQRGAGRQEGMSPGLPGGVMGGGTGEPPDRP
ncbi:MAG TPA: hypothetical protein VNA19_02480 [Pyrinomonadaceae bacterium]|jgi:hypothetical protein|nr:hypothetical protein [Pyrinomonadaceae bacterium]